MPPSISSLWFRQRVCHTPLGDPPPIFFWCRCKRQGSSHCSYPGAAFGFYFTHKGSQWKNTGFCCRVCNPLIPVNPVNSGFRFLLVTQNPWILHSYWSRGPRQRPVLIGFQILAAILEIGQRPCWLWRHNLWRSSWCHQFICQTMEVLRTSMSVCFVSWSLLKASSTWLLQEGAGSGDWGGTGGDTGHFRRGDRVLWWSEWVSERGDKDLSLIG